MAELVQVFHPGFPWCGFRVVFEAMMSVRVCCDTDGVILDKTTSEWKADAQLNHLKQADIHDCPLKIEPSNNLCSTWNLHLPNLMQELPPHCPWLRAPWRPWPMNVGHVPSIYGGENSPFRIGIERRGIWTHADNGLSLYSPEWPVSYMVAKSWFCLRISSCKRLREIQLSD